MSVCSPRFLFARYGLFIQSITTAACAVFLRWLVWRGGMLPFTVDLSVLTIFVSASIFVLTILMGGVMSDYKDAERIPADISSAFDTMLSQIVAISRKRVAPPPRASTLASLRALATWLLSIARLVDGVADDHEAAAAARYEAEIELLVETTSSGAWNTSFAGWIFAVNARLSRMRVIESTDFYLPAYTLFDSLTAVVFVLLLVTRHSNDEMAFLVTGVFTFLFFYLSCFVRALDGPFNYTRHFHTRQCLGVFNVSELLNEILNKEHKTLCQSARVLPSSFAIRVFPDDLKNKYVEFEDLFRIGAAGLNSIVWDVLFEDFAARLVAAVDDVAQ